MARAGYTVLENKYGLDVLYTDFIVGGVKGPIARASYWFNQNVIDGVVNGVGVASRAQRRLRLQRRRPEARSTASSSAPVSASEESGQVSATSRPARCSSTPRSCSARRAIVALVLVFIV